MKTLDEIMKGLDRTDLFVLLISNAALESKWVKTEIIECKNLLDSGKMKQVLPIIIDRSITYKDLRIPNWLRDNYNLRVVPRPNAAYRIINSAFSRLSIESNPRSLRAKKLFVGRNDQLKEFEARIDDYEKSLPCAIVASGLRDIGRKKFLLHALRKANKLDDYHQPIIITVRYEDGIDGFASKMLDLGFSSEFDSSLNLSELKLDEKIDILVKLALDLGSQNEILLIDDWRCIVQFGGTYSEWFLEICSRLPKNRIYFCVAAASSPRASIYRNREEVYHIKVPELNESERLGLLVRYLRDVERLDDVDTSDLSFLRNVLNGYPEQAIYAGEIIKDEGARGALERSSEIVDFARLKASIYVEGYRDDGDKFDLLVFLSWFEFVSLDFIFKIGEFLSVNYLPTLNEFIENGICQGIGTLGEYVRLNDVIRDYVARGSISIPGRFSKAIESVSREILNSEDESDEFDYSEKAVAIRMALLEGRYVPERMLIPAHFLNAISQNYKNKRYANVIELAERVLDKPNYEEYVRNQIRHFYCMALARRRDARFISEVQKIKGEEHNYVLGFYYRKIGRYGDAITRFESAMRERRWEENSKRELVLIFNITEEYDRAFDLAKESYYDFPSNPISVLAYFEVLLNKYKISQYNDIGLVHEMDATLKSISRISSEKGREVEACMRARYSYYVQHDDVGALQVINEAIQLFQRSQYPLLAKMELGISLRSTKVIDDALVMFRVRKFDEQRANEQVKAELFLLALRGSSSEALGRVDRELRFLNPVARERFKQRLISL
jgi:tetratricopeptide (TPR) repeat protein